MRSKLAYKMVEVIPMGKYVLERTMCGYEDEHLTYGFDSTSPGSASSVSSSSRRSSNDDGQIFVFPVLDGVDMKIPQCEYTRRLGR